MLALLQQREDYVPIRELMDAFHISKRTVYYDVDKINGWLKTNHLPPIEYVRRSGFLLPEATRKQLPVTARTIHHSQYNPSRMERKAWLGIHLIQRTEPLFLHDMEELLKVSRGTAHAELKGLQRQLSAVRLRIVYHRKHGYIVEGKEQDQRTALSLFLYDILSHVSWKDFVPQIQGLIHANLYRNQLPILQAEQLSSVYRIIASGERTIGMELTDETVLQLAARLLLFTNRLVQGKQVTMDVDEKDALKKTPQFKAALQISRELGPLFGTEFPEDEICYMTVHLLAAKVNKLEEESHDLITNRLREATSRMIESFEQRGCIHFTDRTALENQLFLHVKSAYYRIKYDLQIENPLTDMVMEKYREVFELTRQSVFPLEELLGKPLDNQQVAYLAMHFGGWLRKEQVKPAPSKTAVIVCVHGVSASRILRLELKRLFPAIEFIAELSLRDYEAFTGQVHFIFSTVPLSECRVPVFIVSPILTDADKAHLLNQVQPFLDGGSGMNALGPSAQDIVDLVKKHSSVLNESALQEDIKRYLAAVRNRPPQDSRPTLPELLFPSRITIREEAADWREAIRIASRPLLDDGSIRQPYVQAMIKAIDEHGPYIVIAPGVAIAHAKPDDGAVRTSMALLALQRSVAFSEALKHQVRLLFIVASPDGDSHLKALTQLSDLLKETKNRMMLENANEKHEIMRLLLPY
ncbi:BglG family transcription antiterminator [Paenibacillus thiaminolyticus]|uniref:BglG family transcription antiterminator n=1 Tax=Paenibacillus thiaminolyticus TaxID=49283 RepID=UPI0030B92F79